MEMVLKIKKKLLTESTETQLVFNSVFNNHC